MEVEASSSSVRDGQQQQKHGSIRDVFTVANWKRIRQVFTVAAIAAGVQFGWALQLSLLTPYVQTLGVPHTWASFIWLCGPISGLLVQPIVGFYSDRCTSKYGRRRPFIVSGAVCVCVAVILIGFAKDIGFRAGDNINATTKPRAVALFVVGFWILDVANNMLQGPCRAFLADLSGGDHEKMRIANVMFAGFMGAGNILGYAAGSISSLYKILPFTKTEVCDVYCANLKTCFLIDIILLLAITTIAIFTVPEIPITRADLKTEEESLPFIGELVGAFKNLKKPMWILLLVTALNWIAWFPFFLYGTDWMGTEVFGGKVTGNKEEQNLYDLGVRAGSLGLMFNSIVLLISSLMIDPVSRLLGGVKRLWGTVNVILAVALSMTFLITKYANDWRTGHGLTEIPGDVKGSALAFFTVLGVPLSVTFSIPFALASIYCSMAGGGQGLSLGVVNMSIVLPQMFVSVVSGPLDSSLGGGNLPAFGMGAIAAVMSVLAIFFLPNPPAQSLPTMATVGGGH